MARLTCELIAVTLGAALTSCSHGGAMTPSATHVARLPAKPISVYRLQPEAWSYTYKSGLEQPVRTVVRDHQSWREVSAQIGRPFSPWNPDVVPGNVDFEREMLIVVALGSRPTGGYSVFVESARVTAMNTLEVMVCFEEPAPESVVTLGVTEPVDIARVERFAGAVSFVERKGVPSCATSAPTMD